MIWTELLFDLYTVSILVRFAGNVLYIQFKNIYDIYFFSYRAYEIHLKSHNSKLRLNGKRTFFRFLIVTNCNKKAIYYIADPTPFTELCIYTNIFIAELTDVNSLRPTSDI